MYWFAEGELASTIADMRQNPHAYRWFWYRDVILQAQERGLLKVCHGFLMVALMELSMFVMLTFPPKTLGHILAGM